MNPKRLFRSRDDRILAGVAAGVADYFDVDPVIVRIIWFLSVFFTGSLTFWAYIVMIIVVPEEQEDGQRRAQGPWAPGGAPIPQAPGGWTASYTAPVPGPAPVVPPVAGDAAPADPNAPVDPNATLDPSATATGPAPDTQPGQVPPASSPFTTGQSQWTAAPDDWRWQRRQDRWQRRQDRWERRGGRGGGLMFGLFLIVVGGLLAWHQIDPHVDLGFTWPLGVIAFGVLLVASSVRFGKS